MPVLGNLLQGFLGALTAPKNTTAQYTGGYNPGTNGMVDPGVNNNQPVGPSWSPIQVSSSQKRWNQIFDPQANQMLMQNNLQGQNAQLANMLAMGQQNNVMPNQLGALQAQMGSTAMSGLQSRDMANQAGGLNSLFQGYRTGGMLPFAPSMGQSDAQNTISANNAGTAQNLNAMNFAQAQSPYQRTLAQIMANTQMQQGRTQGAEAQGGMTRANQQNQFLQDNPGYIPQQMQQSTALTTAEINQRNRQQGYPGSPTVIYGQDNKPTGSVTEQFPSINIPGQPPMNMRQVATPTYAPAPIHYSPSMANPILNGTNQAPTSQVPQLSTPIPSREAGVVPGGVGQAQIQPQPQKSGMDISSLLQSPQVQQMIQQMIQKQGSQTRMSPGQEEAQSFAPIKNWFNNHAGVLKK